MTRAGRDGGTRAARAILSREMAGAVFIILVGSALHFVFDWTGGWRPAALFAAVNESIWEHLKLAFWPGLAWALLPSGSGGAALPERLAVRGYSLALTAILIVAIFVSYTRILGDNLLALDIGTFVLAVVIGQIGAALMLMRGPGSGALLGVGLALLALQLAAYALWTYFPPDHWLFIETRSGLTGIP